MLAKSLFMTEPTLKIGTPRRHGHGWKTCPVLHFLGTNLADLRPRVP